MPAVIPNKLQVLIVTAKINFSEQMTSQIQNPWIRRINCIFISILETRKSEHGEFAGHRAPFIRAGVGRAEWHWGWRELRIPGFWRGPADKDESKCNCDQLSLTTETPGDQGQPSKCQCEHLMLKPRSSLPWNLSTLSSQNLDATLGERGGRIFQRDWH